MVGSEPISNAGKAGVPLTASNLPLRVVSAAVLAPLALVAAYIGGLPFALFWAIAALVVLWEWMTLVVGPNLSAVGVVVRRSDCSCRFLAWLGRPVTALFMVGLGALAGAIFAPSERRLWVIAGAGYAGGMVLAPVFLRADAGFGFAVILLALCDRLDNRCPRLFCRTGFRWPKTVAGRKPEEDMVRSDCGHGRCHRCGTIVVARFGSFDSIAIIAVALLLSVMAQAGDLFDPG